MNKKEIQDGLLRNFNFTNVREVMSSVGWTWYNRNESPSERELLECSIRLIRQVLEDPRDNVSIGTGGLCVTKLTEDGVPFYKLVFELEDTWA